MMKRIIVFLNEQNDENAQNTNHANHFLPVGTSAELLLPPRGQTP